MAGKALGAVREQLEPQLALNPMSPGDRGQLVEIDRDRLPPLEEGEYYHADLVGLPCVDEAGQPVGAVVAVENFGAGDLLEVERPNGKRSLIPFRDPIARLGGNRIVLDPEFLA